MRVGTVDSVFEVAALARHSISVTEITREANQQNPRIPAMMGNLEEEPAKRKVPSLHYISIGKTGRKMLMNKFNETNIRQFNWHNYCNSVLNVSKHGEIEHYTISIHFVKKTEADLISPSFLE